MVTTKSQSFMPQDNLLTKSPIALTKRIVTLSSENQSMAPIVKSEAQRLKVLWQYDVLDTVPEEVF